MIRNIRILPVILFALVLAAQSHAESAYELNREGLEHFEREEYQQAAEAFEHAADQAPEDVRIDYNRAAALARSGKMEEAAPALEALQQARDATVARRATYGAGVAAYEAARAAAQQQEIDEALQLAARAVENNRKVLLDDPADEDARYNYELARQLKMQLEQQKQQQQDQEKQDEQKKDDEKQDEEKQDQQQKDEQQDKQEQSEQQKGDDQKQQDQEKQDEQQQQQQEEEQQQEQQEKEKQQQDGEQQDQQPSEQQEQQASEEMQQQFDETDAEMNVLNMLEDNDAEELKRLLRGRYRHAPVSEKDW